ncbi:channel protein VirB6 [Vibrio ichthyoenteri ATCC 700023]|uniref:Channel protein VirB6 n=1 Tax=Vibrio ichthyoenteri ATCC 700023 TaxID=870968 RepID=F9S7R6_9VIBR|nr:type IV secretion system protein [Vibrio ichthyoenteri]EGU30966.1 channel protein VirB6 [Vibrio ichthyoenteri ATCC 700023]
MDEIAIFQFIGMSIDNATQSFLINGVKNIINSFEGIMLIAVTLFIMVRGYLIMEGKIEAPMEDFVHHCVVIFCIFGLAWSAPTYTKYIVEGVEALSTGMANSILPNSGGNKDPLAALDALLKMGIEQIIFCWNKVGYTPSSWQWILLLIVIGGGILALTLISALIIIGTKFMLALLLIIGPLFFVAFCFPVTKKFFESWLAKVLENILVQFFGVSVIFMAIEIIESFLKANNMTDNAALNPISVGMQIAVVCAILFFVIRQIPNLAGSLSGGFASQNLTAKDFKNLVPRRNQEQQKNQDKANAQRSSDGWDNSNNIRSGNNGRNNSTGANRDMLERIKEHNQRMNQQD